MAVGGIPPSALRWTVAHEAMNPGIVTVSADASVREVAATMAVRCVHAVLLTDQHDDATAADSARRDLDESWPSTGRGADRHALGARRRVVCANL